MDGQKMGSAQGKKGPRNVKGKENKDYIRTMGNNEAFQQAQANRDDYKGTVVTCRYAIPPELAGSDASAQLTDAIETAVSQVVLRHPLLHVGIQRAYTKLPVWVRLDSIDLGQHIEWRFPDASADMASLVHEVTEAEINTRFENIESRPGWKLVILRKPAAGVLEAVFNFNHVNTDGIGARIFHEHLLECLNNPGTEEAGMAKQHISNHILKLPAPTVEFPLPLERSCKLKLDATYAIKLLWQEYRPAIFCNDDTQANWAPIRGAPYSTPFRSFNVEAGSLATLLARSREHNTTITGLLHSLTLVSIASQITTAPGFQSGTPMDQRRFLPTDRPGFQRPERTVANYVTMADHEYPAKLVAEIRHRLQPTTKAADANADDDNGLLPASIEELVWSVAAKVRADIRDKVELGTRNDMIGVAKFVKDWTAYLEQTAQKPRQQSWHVTNLGIIEGTSSPNKTPKPEAEAEAEVGETTPTPSSGGGWSIREAQFVLSSEVPTAPIMISPVSVRGGPLCVSFSWQDNVVGADVAGKLVADVERWLNQLASASS